MHASRSYSLFFMVFASLGVFGGVWSLAQEESAPQAIPAPGLWKLEKGLATPESAYYDAGTDAIYVANVDGAPDAKDGKGFISKVSVAGKMLEEKWIDGLNAPKGLRAFGKTLYATDLDALVAIDLKTGKVLSRTPIAGAKLLNDIGIDSEGSVYVSDIIANAIYLIKDGKAIVWVSGKDVPHPNGLLVHDEELVVAGWGEELDPVTYATKTVGKLYAFNLKSKERIEIVKEPLGNLDGLENDGSGGYYVSDYVAGKVYHIEPDGTASLLLQGFKGAADIGVVESKGLLLVPRMEENKLTAYEIEKF